VNERENRNILRHFRKTARVEADVMSRGRLFQTRLPATGKARSPTVASRVRRITNSDGDDERRQRRTRQHVGCGWRGILERDRSGTASLPMLAGRSFLAFTTLMQKKTSVVCNC